MVQACVDLVLGIVVEHILCIYVDELDTSINGVVMY